ncbi:hypothetical protein L6452_10085 [Arctium lappa]|uniref:Uncharacterized protein n=1 Tax=Arctium lappa TaxID=4217 RepID=A0ACB9DMD3_ARCLA|nr:hypothetical protein L6452_10085 [Arctium lappa]
MNSAMAQQQEFFMKLLEDRDASHRQPEARAENIVNGSGGGPNVVSTEEQLVSGGKEKVKGCTYKAFLGCNPKEFPGSANPVTCMYWLKEVEMAFESSECNDSQRVKFTSQLLRGDALIWWNLTRSALNPEVLGKLTWPVFKKKIIDKYCSERSLDKLEEEFRCLKKGTLSVTDYSKLFLEKLNLVGHLVVMKDPRSKFTSSLLVEDDMVAEKEEKGQAGGKSGNGKGHLGPFVNLNRLQVFGDNHRELRWCYKCKTKHSGPCNPRPHSGPAECVKCGEKGHTIRECPIWGPICFECRESGHMRKDCPKIVGGNRGNSFGSAARIEQPSRAPTRAFRMTTEEAKETADVISGTFLVNFLPARVLFDSGATCSFVSDTFCEHSSPLVCLMGCALEIDGNSFGVDLLPMTIGGFDVVIGIDWLSRHKADILCSKKIIRVPLPEGGVVTVYGEKGRDVIPSSLPLGSVWYADKIGRDWTGQNWTVLDWTGQEARTGLDRTRQMVVLCLVRLGLDRTGLNKFP